MPKTLLAIGAHYDDCVFGVPGLMLKAIRKNYRVVILAMIGDYTNWPPVKGREKELLAETVKISKDYGAEMRYLDFASMQFDVNEATKRAVAEVVADVQPDIAFTMWPSDRHADHEVAAALSKVALYHGARLLGDRKFKSPSKEYQYDNGPRHTVGFVPDTFVDVTDEWEHAMDWLGRFMALVRNEQYDPKVRDGAQRGKETLAMYRGATCGVKYAEAFRAAHAVAQEIL